MERWNGEAIPRSDLAWALTQRRFVEAARRVDRCLLCCGPRVNEAGICDLCWALLSDEELRRAQRWLTGIGP